MSNSSILPIYKTLSGATTVGQSGSGSDITKGYSAFPKFIEEFYLSAGMQSVYSAAPTNWLRLFSIISRTLTGGVLLLCRYVISVSYSPSRLS